VSGGILNPAGEPPPAPESELDLRLGELVVYGSYGLGRISRIGKGEGAQPSGSVVLEFADGLSVTLPRDRAVTCLRSVCGADELARVREVLRRRDVAVERSWQLRTRSTRTKIAAGQTVGLAEIIRDTVALGRGSSTGTVSMYERELYLKARRLLSAEVGAATGTGETCADAWIEVQLEASAGERQSDVRR
jgi:RNA polymerase-interacting CarD/CdnL/TRCF family regulator